jgi:phage terminase Nu1 subunit (DNA packaging protein)
MAEGRIVTLIELSEITGLSVRHLRRLAAAGILERVGRGKVELGQAVKALLAHVGTTAGDSLTEERTRLVRAQARRHELANAHREGELVPERLVTAFLSELSYLYTSSLESWPGRLAAELAGMTNQAEVRAVLHREVRQTRRALARKILETWHVETTDHTAA